MIQATGKFKSIVSADLRAFIAAMILVFVALVGQARAAGLLVADGGFGGVLEIETHDVQVTINNGVAVTRVTQVFRNTENRQVEALYTFPVPRGASVANFSMWIDGKEMVGEVVEKQRAREIYNSYKQQRRDPGLLEQVDYKTFEMRIFPIAANARQQVQIIYYQELDVDHDSATYVYPLATVTGQPADTRTTGGFTMDLRIRSAVPIVAVDSPSHPDAFAVVQHSDTFAQASLETAQGSLAVDVVVHCRSARPATGLDLITSRQKGEDGFFLLTLTAGAELAEPEPGMDYVFLLDISGSMGTDGKLIASKNALGAFVRSLDETDRFDVMTFNVGADALFNRLHPGTEAMKAEADAFLRSQRAKGGTVLAPALSAAYRYQDPDRTLNVIVLSDGLTEQRERQTLLERIRTRPGNTRVFCIGVGNEVNRPLLEQMAEDAGGLAAFVSRGDDFERQAGVPAQAPAPGGRRTGAAVRRHPGLRRDPRASAQPVSRFTGAPLWTLQRIGRGPRGPHRRGQRCGPQQDGRAFLSGYRSHQSRDRAHVGFRRVDELLKQADRSGSRQQVAAEVVRLAEAFSIVTEYTSFLVLENDAEYQRWKIDRRNAVRTDRERGAQALRDRDLDRIRCTLVCGM